MTDRTFSARYTAAIADSGGRCPIEAGVIARLADHECRHGRLPFDHTPPCGCWLGEGAALLGLRRTRVRSSESRRAA